MVKVLITVDTEVYPLLPNWRIDSLERDIRRDIFGQTPKGDVGLSFQLETLSRYGLKAVFFVESLFASAVGFAPLRDIVQRIHEAGQEIQLHLHPEWLAWTEQPCVAANGRKTIAEFSKEEQCKLIGKGLENIWSAGSENVNAFRAGDFAANQDTLRALRENGIRYDSSMNWCYENSFPECNGEKQATQPFVMDGVWELPITYWKTAPFGYRHAQLVSSSVAELTAALWHAQRHEWSTFVIVSHSFELLAKRRKRPAEAKADYVVVSRFVKLCEFLADHRESFVTCGFHDLNFAGAASQQKAPLSSPIYRTLHRHAEQLYRRTL